jgi:hypothetical protein
MTQFVAPIVWVQPPEVVHVSVVQSSPSLQALALQTVWLAVGVHCWHESLGLAAPVA